MPKRKITNGIIRRSYKNGNEWIAFGLVFLIALGIVWFAVNYSETKPITISVEEQRPYFAPTEEFREQNVLKVDGTTVLVGRDCLAIVAETTEERAEAIELGLTNQTGERPNAWDGWASMLQTFDIKFEAVTLYGRTSDAYLSRAIFRTGGDVLDLDMRPSDAIALALRTGTPIYLNMTMLREVGKNIC